jgi:3-hydroxybutyrate dehydrogenase
MAPDTVSSTATSLRGRTAVVTGSTSGIGLGTARALATAGANLMLNGFGDAAQIEATRAALAREHNVGVSYNGADMSKPEAIAAMIADAEKEFGGVDILVNNAGIQHVAPVEEFPVEKWNAILAINLSAAFHTIRLVVPGMKRRKWGRIINIASAHALVASPFKTAYVAAKHGLFGLTKTVALEVAEFGITVNAICPGYVLTPLVEKQIPQYGQGARHHQAASRARRAAGGAADQAIRRGGRDRGTDRVSRLRHGAFADRNRPPDRRRLDRALSGNAR